jgi:hypothetical protein
VDSSKLIEIALDLFLAGVDRGAIVTKVREMEAAGSTPTEITNVLEQMRHDSRRGAEEAVRSMPEE